MQLINMDVSTLIEQCRKPDANPGGGAVLILTSNLATNLILMMDKKENGEEANRASVSRETLLENSRRLTELMQDDVENFNKLMDKIKAQEVEEADYLLAADALLQMVDINLDSLKVLEFFLENGKSSTLTDGEIANNLLLESINSAMPTIRINLLNTSKPYDYDMVKKVARKIYNNNKEIIERRKK